MGKTSARKKSTVGISRLKKGGSLYNWRTVVTIVFALISSVVIYLSFAATGDVANLWVDGSSSGSCTVQSGTGGAYQSGQGCASASAAYTKASNGQTIRFVAGTYGGLSVSGSKSVTFIGTGDTTKISSITFGGGSNVSVDSVYVSGGADAEAANTVAISNSKLHGNIYIAGTTGLTFSHNVVEPEPGKAANFNNNDMIDIYPDGTGTPNIPNHNITIQDSVFHGLRTNQSGPHPDAIQSYNNGAPHTGIKILRNKFYDNECINLRANPNDDYTIEDNTFADSVNLNGCGFYSMDVGYANVTARYNTFTGGQSIQETPNISGTHQTWVGNVGAGFSVGCNSGGASGATMSHNVWTDQKCGSTDIQVGPTYIDANGNGKLDKDETVTSTARQNLKMDSNGVLQAGSPAFGAGDSANYPPIDLLGNTRALFNGAPDAGAIATHITGGGTPGDTTPPTVSITAPTSGTTVTGATTLTANAADAGGVSSVQFRVDGNDIGGADAASPYSVSWDSSTVSNGSHSITALAYDNASNSTLSSTVTITVNNVGPCTGSTAAICEDFGAGAANFTTSGGDWAASAGKYNLTNPTTSGDTASGVWNTALHNTAVSGNFTLTLDASTIDTGSSFNDFATIFNYQDANNYYAASFSETNDTGSGGIFKMSGGVWTRLVAFANPITASTTYPVKIVKTGTTIQAYQNNTLIGTATDSSFSGGKVGFGTRNDSAIFDNLIVTATGGAGDTTPPITTISSGPGASTTATTASFVFAGTDNVTPAGSLTFECQLDAGTFAACTSPKAYTGLAVGQHTFNVRAKDAAGNTDTSPASSTWTITTPADTVLPTTSITSSPAASTSATSAVLSFSGSDDTTPTGSLTFECKLDSGSFAACTSPKTYTNLALGGHTFSVRAKDGAGNLDASPAMATWTVVAPPDTTDPTTSITAGPAASTSATSASFSFSGTDDTTPAGSLTFECQLDSGSFSACTSPKAYSGIGVGSHTFSVRATDAAGNVDTSPAAYPWTIVTPPDTTPPSVPANVAAAAPTSAQVNVSWSASTGSATQYKIYRTGGTAGAKTFLVSAPTLTYQDALVSAATSYSYQVTALDSVGNESAKGNVATVTTPAAADLTAPTTPTNFRSTNLTDTSVSLAWNASTDSGGSGLAGYHLFRKKNNETAQPVTSFNGTTYTDSGLEASTSYTYTLVAYDNAANGSTAASLQITTSAPPVTHIKGDGNGDGKVTIKDLNAVINNFGAGVDKPSVAPFTNGDCDGSGDGKVTIKDLSAVITNFGFGS